MNQQDIENQIKAIPGNESVLEEMYKLLDAEEAIAFVGAGASAGLWPLWDEFLTGFVEHSLKLGKITQPEADYFKNDASQNPLETAQQLRDIIGVRDYCIYLQEIFKDKISPQTGGAFTLTHKALLQLPIHNYLTLNYDAGLTNARAALYPKATTSYFFWDQEEARRIHERGYKRLVLHAHGRHDRAESIILTLNDYRKAYDNNAFVRLLNDLFNNKKLIFIGFGMTDPYIKQLFNNISKDSNTSPFQHIAFVGLNESEMQMAHLNRERAEMVYGARVLLYPTENHHKALTDWLQMLVEKYSESASSRTAEKIKPHPASPQIKAVLHDKYIHKPPNDENFKGRVGDFATLNRWANDPDTNMIAITGIGGQGKTAMTGHWLKQERTENLAQIPVFYWSFYEDLDVGKFLEQVVEFCLPIVRIYGKQEIEPISSILSIVQQERLLLVLDGLEVLQEDASGPNHGKVTHPLLNPFLQKWVRVQHKGLMILTSRFHFPELLRYSGVGFHQIDLVQLSKEDGVSLLEKLNIFGEKNLLETYVEKLYGHPLALRVLVSTVKRCCYGDLSQFKDEDILVGGGGDDDDDDGLSQKLEHLLSFYERHLQGGQGELLGIISLFKRPVETESFVTLLGKMKSLANTPLAKADAFTIEQQLNLLIDDFLIEKTDEGITTHPVIRDYFRAGHKLAGTRREVADFLKARPGAEQPKNIDEVRDLVEAV
ncbi:MAG: SIR2 family protein [Deltaproteobacteria bacterium]|nr:SIR2 family protein [Deltaproteobacteria bacterium]